MDSLDKQTRVEEELEVLEGIIDYSDRMIYEEGRRGEYVPLRRQAYGKMVVLETEKAGILKFRLSSTSAVYPNYASGYTTPYSPVGRLCSIIQPGYENESQKWGQYRAIEVRLFDRYDGVDFERNVRNFLRMDIKRESDSLVVTNLRSFLKKANKKRQQEIVTEDTDPILLQADERAEDEVNLISDETVTHDQPPIVITEYEMDEDSDFQGLGFDVDDEESEDSLSFTPVADEEYFGLSETFYLNRTLQQDEVISRSPLGAMYVEGVAGSGKTSAALGRTKMLCDFNARNVFSEADFLEILGDAGEYWSERFAGQFSQESSVGFVRTGELIQYLKETCRRLDLPNLPVEEYPELRSRLKHLRRIELSRQGSNHWTGLSTPRKTHLETSMAWLKSTDRAIAICVAENIANSIPSAEYICNVFKAEFKQLSISIAQPALELLKEKIQLLIKSLEHHTSLDRFALDSLAKHIKGCIDPVRLDLLGKQTIWVNIGNRYLYADSERELAKALIESGVPLYLQPSSRLVFFNENGLMDDQLDIVSRSGLSIDSKTVTKELIKREKYIVVDNVRGETLPAVGSDIDDLYIRLLSESMQKIFIQEGGKLKRLKFQRGLGRLALPTISAEKKAKPDADPDHPNKSPEQLQSSRSVQAVFTSVMRKSLLQPLVYVADMYADALQKHPQLFPDNELVADLIQQFGEKKLTDEDIDLLLCLYHLIGKGFDGNPQQLTAPPYYQSVFIDEVQDFTEQQIFLMAEQAAPEYFAVTLVGDPAQKLHDGSRVDVNACFAGKSLQLIKLTKNMRQADAPAMAWFSARFRTEVKRDYLGDVLDEEFLDYVASSPAKISGPELWAYENVADLVSQVVNLLKSVPHRETVAVILPNADKAHYFHNACRPGLTEHMIDTEVSERIDLSRRHVRHFTEINNAKGLEFDWVILPYFEHYDIENSQHQNQIYVALTRARKRLIIIGHNDRAESAFDYIWLDYKDIVTSI